MKHFPGLVTIGYLLIFCCIGLIGYAYYYVNQRDRFD